MFRIARNIEEAEYPELWRGLVGAWSPCLQRHKNNILYDLSGNKNHGTLTNMDAATDWVVSGGRQALDFAVGTEPTANKVTVKVPAFGLSNFAVAMWCSPSSSYSTGMGLFSDSYVSGGGAWSLGFASSTNNVRWLLPGLEFNDSTTVLATGTTYLVGGQRVGITSAGAEVWVNGKRENAFAVSAASSIIATSNAIGGARFNTGGSYGGRVFDALVYNVALTASEWSLLNSLGPGGWAQRKKSLRPNIKHFFFSALLWNTIDTRNKRASSLSVSVPTGRAYMLPDGSLRNRADKRHQTLNYRFSDATYAITLGGSVNIEDLLRVNTSQSTNLGWLLQLSMPNTRTTLYPTLTHRVSRENKLPARNVSEAKYPELWNGLVGAWSPCLQKHKNNILYDLSGNKNHGVLTNMDPETDWVISRGMTALDFDGSNYVACGNSGWPNGKHWSLSSWIRLGTMSSSTLYVLCRTGMSSGGAYFGINRLTPANIRWRLTLLGVADYDFAASTLYGVDDGLWHHVGLWHDGNNALLFVDGKQVESKSVGTAVIPSGNTNIGFFDNGVNFGFVGQVSDLVIRNTMGNQLPLMYRLGPGGWAAAKDREFYSLTRNTNENTILSCESLSRVDSSPITAQVLYPVLTHRVSVDRTRPPARNASEAKYPELWRGLVGAWSPALQRHKNDRLYDLSGNNNHGTLTNMDTSDWVTSGGRQALDFDGSNDYVSFGSSVVNKLINGASSVMVSMWFQYGTLNALQYSNKLFCGRVNNTTLANVWMNIRGDAGNSGKILFGGRSRAADGFQERSTSAVLAANTLYHVVGVLDFGSDSIYTAVNGSWESPTSVTFGNSIYVEPNFSSTVFDSICEQNASSGVPANAIISDVLLMVGYRSSIAKDLFSLGPGGWATPKERSFYLLPQKTPLHVTPIEALTSVNPGSTTLNEWLSNLLLPSITLIEHQGPAAETFYSVLNTESLEGINNSNTIPLEYQGATALAVYPVINLENLAQLARDNSVVTENITQLAGSHTIDKEFIGRLLHSNTVTLEELLKIIRDGYIQTEGLSTARINPALNVEIIGNLKGASIANIEWHSSLLRNSNVNLEYLQGVSIYPVFLAEMKRLIAANPAIAYDLRALLNLNDDVDVEFTSSLSQSGTISLEKLLGSVYTSSIVEEILAFLRDNEIIPVEYGVLPLTTSSYDWILKDRLRVWVVDNRNRTWVFLNHGGKKVE